ncbi:MAG: lipoyl(octanoyl) transferase LipB [Dehalococcoidia bacterium]
MTAIVRLLRLGRSDYRTALNLQRELHASRKLGNCSDHLLLTEHEPVLTLGRGADERFVRASASSLAELGIELIGTERGGNVTYHGPGQLVIYPILDLRAYGRDVHRYIRCLEESVLRLLGRYGLAGRLLSGTPGVWVGERKIASVGVFVSQWTTMHGLAINIAPDLRQFALIHPCGLVDGQMTSIAAEIGLAPPMEEVSDRYASIFAEVFDADLREEDLPPAVEAASRIPTSQNRPHGA